MPEEPLTPDKRRIAIDPATIEPPPRAPFVELGLVSCFSFLRGASDAVDLALTARALGYDAVGIADANTMAGVVRLHSEAKTLKLRPVIGCRIETVEGLAFLAYPIDRAAYGRLCRLISAGRMSTLAGEWQDKGVCDISLAMLAEHGEGVQLILLPPGDLDAELTIEAESNVVPFPGAWVLREGPSASSVPAQDERFGEKPARPEERLRSREAASRRRVSKDRKRKTPVPGALGRGFVLSVRHAYRAASLARSGQQGGNPPLTAMSRNTRDSGLSGK